MLQPQPSGSSNLTTSELSSAAAVEVSRPSALPWQYIALLVIAWLLIYAPGLSSPPLLDDADSIHAEAAKEMLSRGDFVTLHANGVRYLDKAPLLYWCTAASYAVFGANEFATRLPLSLFVLAWILAAFFLARDIAGDEAGALAGLVLSSAIGPYIFTRFLIPDVVVGLWLTLTALLFLRSLDQERPSHWLCWGIAALAALNVLTKGLIGVVFPVAIIVGYLIITRDLRRLLRMHILSSTAVFFAIAAPWHILAIVRNPPQGAAKGFFWFYFINEQLYRYLNKRIPRDYDKVPLLLFWGLMLLWVFPWTPYVVGSLRSVPVRWRRFVSLERRDRALLLLAVWALAVLVFFSFSTRQEYYVVPALPALAVLAGIWLADPARERSRRIASYFVTAVGLIAGLISLVLGMMAKPLPPGTDFAETLKRTPELYARSLGHFFDLTSTALGGLRAPLIIFGIGMLAAAVSALVLRRASALRSGIALTFSIAIVLYAVHLALIVFSPILGSKPLAEALQKHYRPGDVVVVNGEYANASTVNFYTGIQLHMLNGRVNGLWYGSLFPDSPQVFEDDKSFADLWRGDKRVFYITADDRHDAEAIKPLGVPAYPIARAGGKSVYSNRP